MEKQHALPGLKRQAARGGGRRGGKKTGNIALPSKTAGKPSTEGI